MFTLLPVCARVVGANDAADRATTKKRPATILCMTMMTPEAVSRAYNNRLSVPNYKDVLRLWDEQSARARQDLSAAGRGHWDLPYGPRPLNTLDVVEAKRPGPAARGKPDGQGAPILFFIHGGYWRMLDKSAQTFIAPEWTKRGAMVVIPNYTLAPAVSLEDICLEVAQALAWVWQHANRFGGDPERIVVAGHSAGGHLTGMALSLDGSRLGRAMGLRLPKTLAAHGVAISGLFDLAPLLHCEWLMPDIRLTPESVVRLSPACWAAPMGRRMLAVAGALESSEFHRQNALIRQAWGARAVPVVETIPGRNHFDVLLELVGHQSRLCSLLAGELGLESGI